MLEATATAIDDTVTVRIVGGRPPTTNIERQGNRWRRASATKTWRDQTRRAADTAGCLPVVVPVVVLVTPLHKDRRSPQDAGACAPAAKAVIDGLVDAGILPGDDPRFVSSITYTAPFVDGDDGLLVSVAST